MNKFDLVNLSNSILKHYYVPTFHNTIPELDEKLNSHKKIALFLFDGMGKNIIESHLKEDSFIRSHYFTTINSVFPPTTVAATKAVLTGKYPIETGWMAWSMYFDEYQRNVILFRNVDYNTEEKIDTPFKIADQVFPTKELCELIKEYSPETDTIDIRRYPVQVDGPKKLEQARPMINKALKGKDNAFLYFYFDSPDYEMHDTGIDSNKVHHIVHKIDKFMKKIVKENPDTLFITIADHGHINVKYMDICEHDDFYSLLDKPLTLEKRSPGFFVKEENRDKFVSLFNKYYGEHFALVSKQDVLDKKLYGEGKQTKKIVDFIPDYIAMANDEYSLYASKELKNIDLFKGHHAGNTKEEKEINISVYEN